MSILNGTNSGDGLMGTSSPDTLIGGLGDDRLYGQEGDDTYEFWRGDGSDSISEYTGDNDVVQFMDVASTAVLAVEQEGAGLLIRYGAADRLHIDYYFAGTTSTNPYLIETFLFSDGVRWDRAAIEARGAVTAATSGDDTIWGWPTKASDLLGGAGNDLLIGGNVSNVMNGGTGNDTLQGGDGNDTFVFLRGDGVDVARHFDDSDGYADSFDIVQFPDVRSTELSFAQAHYDLVINYGSSDQVTLQGFLNSPDARGTQFKFSDGVVWDYATVVARAANYGTPGDDFIEGFSGPSQLFGLAGDDYLSGATGDDKITGGIGNDVLSGGGGSDTFIFSRGDGVDRLAIDHYNDGATDTVQFMDVNSSAQAIVVERSLDDLIISYGTSDKLVMVSYYSYTHGSYQWLFSDGVLATQADINQRGVVRATALDDVVFGFDGKPNDIAGLAGNDSITGGDGNDKLSGGLGNDTLMGKAGSDIYTFARGDGADAIRDLDSQMNTIRFSDIKSGELSVAAIADNLQPYLLLKYGTTDQIALKSTYGDGPLNFRIEFSDGVVWDAGAIRMQGVITGTDGADELAGVRGGPNQLKGLAGNDYLSGQESNDLLDGGSGNDHLSGNSGNDTLNGGAGDDYLYGGFDLDLAVFSGSRANYEVHWQQVKDMVGGDGTDILSDIERARFTDLNLAFDFSRPYATNGPAAIVAKLVGLLFGKDAVNNQHLVGHALHYADQGLSAEQLLMLGLQVKLGADPSHKQIVELYCANLFAQPLTAEQQQPFVAMLDDHLYSVAQFSQLAAESGLNQTNIGLIGLLDSGLAYQPFNQPL